MLFKKKKKKKVPETRSSGAVKPRIFRKESGSMCRFIVVPRHHFIVPGIVSIPTSIAVRRPRSSLLPQSEFRPGLRDSILMEKDAKSDSSRLCAPVASRFYLVPGGTRGPLLPHGLLEERVLRVLLRLAQCRHGRDVNEGVVRAVPRRHEQNLQQGKSTVRSWSEKETS